MAPLKPWWLLVTFLSGMAVGMLAMAMNSEDLILEHRNNRLEFSAPRTDFFAGKSAQRLENALEVPFAIQTTLWSGNNKHVFKSSTARFIVSKDIFDPKPSFSVVMAGVSPRRAVAHQSAKGAQAWCLSQMSLDTTGLSGTEHLWARLDIRAEEPAREGSVLGDKVDPSGISLLTTLIDVFSKPPGSQPSWVLDYSPSFTLDSLRHTRGS